MTRTDKQRISSAFKNLRNQGIDATSNFGSERKISRWSSGHGVWIDTTVFDLRSDKMVVNGLGEDNNIEDPIHSTRSMNIRLSGADPDVVVAALEAEGLYIDIVSEYGIRVLSHKQHEYDNARWDKGYEAGNAGQSGPTIRKKVMGDGFEDLDTFYTNGWINGVFSHLEKKDPDLSEKIYAANVAIRQRLDKQANFRAVIPMLNALI